MDTGLSARVAVVTGAAQGIGAAIARALHGEGARVVLVDLERDRAQALAAQLDPSGRTALAVGADVGARADFAGALEQTLARFARLDVLVNNAAQLPIRGFFEIDDREWDAVLGVNLRSVFLGCQLAGAHMRAAGFGRIINMTSVAGQEGATVLGAHYAASKGAVVALTKSVARELAPYGVTVNAVAPGVIRTPRFDAFPPAQLEAAAAAVPARRLGQPDDVAGAVLYLASDAAGYVTGATLDVNGGALMR